MTVMVMMAVVMMMMPMVIEPRGQPRKKAFSLQIPLALEFDLPLYAHARDAGCVDDFFHLLKEALAQASGNAVTYRYPDMAEIGGTEADLDKRWRRQKQTGEDGGKQMARFVQPIDIESRALGQEYLALLQSRRPRWLVGRGTAGRWGGCPAAA